MGDPRLAGVLGESCAWCPFLQRQVILAEVSGEQVIPLRPSEGCTTPNSRTVELKVYSFLILYFLEFLPH